MYPSILNQYLLYLAPQHHPFCTNWYKYWSNLCHLTQRTQQVSSPANRKRVGVWASWAALELSIAAIAYYSGYFIEDLITIYCQIFYYSFWAIHLLILINRCSYWSKIVIHTNSDCHLSLSYKQMSYFPEPCFLISTIQWYRFFIL